MNARRPCDPLFLAIPRDKKTTPQFISSLLRNLIKEAYLSEAEAQTEVGRGGSTLTGVLRGTGFEPYLN